MNFQKHAATRTATNTRVAPTPPWYRAAMMQPPSGGSIGFYDDPDEDTIEMVLSPEDMGKLARAAEEQPVAPMQSAPPAFGSPSSEALRPRTPPATANEAPTTEGTKAQAEHLLHMPPEAAQSKLPTASSTPRALHPESPATASSDAPAPQGKSAEPAGAPVAAPSTPRALHAEPTVTPDASPVAPGRPAEAPNPATAASTAPRVPQPAVMPTPRAPSAPRVVPVAVSSDSPRMPLAEPPATADADANPPQKPSAAAPLPAEARKGATANSLSSSAGAKPGTAKNRRSALLAGGALAAVAAALVIVGLVGSWSTPAQPHGVEQHPATLALPIPQPPQPPAAVAPQEPAAVAPPAEPQQTTEPQPATPVRFKNPFDRSEIFEFPAGTSQEDARQSVADLLLQRARDRRHPGVAQRRIINGVTPGQSARDTDLAQNSVRGR